MKANMIPSKVYEDLNKSNKSNISSEDIQKIELGVELFRNNGVAEPHYDKAKEIFEYKKATVRDVFNSATFAHLIPEITERIMMDTIPHQPLISTLFQEIDVPKTQSYTFTQMSNFEAHEIAEGSEYPQVGMDDNELGFKINMGVKKYGMRLAVTQEVLDNNLFDIVGMWLMKAKNALIRRREHVCFDLIQQHGTIIFDNITPANAIEGSLGGRDITGAANGTMTLENILTQYMRMREQGFNPDTIYLHPFAWKMFAVDPELKDTILSGALSSEQYLPNGQASNLFRQLNTGLGLRFNGTGNPTLNAPYTDPNTSRLLKLGPDPFTQEVGVVGNTYNIKPGFFPGGSGMNVIVSPFVPYSTVGGVNVTDIIMVDSNEVGIIGRQSQPKVEDYDDASKDVYYLKIMERYGAAILNQGKAINVAKNVVVDRNHVFKDHVVNINSFAKIDTSEARVTS